MLWTASVYPRVCGATPSTLMSVTLPKGLSPRVRGHPGRDRARAGATGSIPACAGPPGHGSFVCYCVTVYPRVCGATSPENSMRTDSAGLSPRVRGHLQVLPAVGMVRGSIPACAGPPVVEGIIKSSHEVYPRVCGATKARIQAVAIGKGLSPRVRGHLFAHLH